MQPEECRPDYYCEDSLQEPKRIYNKSIQITIVLSSLWSVRYVSLITNTITALCVIGPRCILAEKIKTVKNTPLSVK